MASDENYAPYLCTAMYSLLCYTHSNIQFYVLDGGIEDKSKVLIDKSLSRFKHYSVEYINMANFNLNRFPNLKHYSLNTFSRYFIPELKPHLGKVLYLDVDIICKSDILELYSQDLQGFPLGAVLEDFYGLNGEYIKKHIDSGFKSGKKSFNAGVMMLDIQQFIAHNYADILINKTIKLADKLSCPDQDIFNIVFENNYKILDYKFNFMIDLYKQFEYLYPQKAKETMRSPCIIHYVAHKPWQNRLSLGQRDFDEIARQTLFAKAILRTQNASTNHKSSLLQKIFSITNHKDGIHKVITICGVRIKTRRKLKR